MNRIKSSLLILTFVFLSSYIFSYEFVKDSFAQKDAIRSYLQNVDKGYPPIFIEDWIIFSTKKAVNPNYIGISFAHEDFTKIHFFKKNLNDTFIFAYKIPNDLKKIRYRLVEDGLWMRDCQNSNIETDNRGFEISYLDIPYDKIKYSVRKNPIIEGENVTFVLEEEPNHQVFLTGDFISWDPFTYLMQEISPGLYSITIRVSKGKHRYLFIKDGIKILDKRNTQKDTSKLEGVVSFFQF